MAKGVFHQGLQKQGRHQAIEGGGFDTLFESEAVAQSRLLDLNVAFEESQVFAERNLLAIRLTQGQPQQLAERGQRLLSGTRVTAEQSGHSIERIEQEMRLQLRLERMQSCARQVRLKQNGTPLALAIAAIEVDRVGQAYQRTVRQNVQQVRKKVQL